MSCMLLTASSVLQRVERYEQASKSAAVSTVASALCVYQALVLLFVPNAQQCRPSHLILCTGAAFCCTLMQAKLMQA